MIGSGWRKRGHGKLGGALTPNRLARSCVKTIQPTEATISNTTRTMKKVPTGLTIFGRGCGPGCLSGWGSSREKKNTAVDRAGKIRWKEWRNYVR